MTWSCTKHQGPRTDNIPDDCICDWCASEYEASPSSPHQGCKHFVVGKFGRDFCDSCGGNQAAHTQSSPEREKRCWRCKELHSQPSNECPHPHTEQEWHGISYTKLYRTFQHIKQRCNNPKGPSYYKYGARGIKCLWPDFQSFRRDMEASFEQHVRNHGEKNTTIDRIDSDGHYSKENCRWATYAVQNNNRRVHRNQILIQVGKDKKTLPQWALAYKINVNTLYNRIYRYGWDVEEAVVTPPKPMNQDFRKKVHITKIKN